MATSRSDGGQDSTERVEQLTETYEASTLTEAEDAFDKKAKGIGAHGDSPPGDEGGGMPATARVPAKPNL
jgi:hypothetical protein